MTGMKSLGVTNSLINYLHTLIYIYIHILTSMVRVRISFAYPAYVHDTCADTKLRGHPGGFQRQGQTGVWELGGRSLFYLTVNNR